MNMITLNGYHEEVIKKYNNALNSIIYQATMNDNAQLFLDARELLDTVIRYSDEFYKTIKDGEKLDEWIFMYPNMSYYAMAGFLLAKRAEYKDGQIEELSEKLLDSATDAIGDLSDILKAIDDDLDGMIKGTKIKEK